MKLTRAIKASDQEFYDYLEQELIKAIQTNTQREISAKDIKKGLSYRKYEDNAHAQVQVNILDYQRGSYYKAEVKSLSDTVTITYETSVEKDELIIKFTQSIESYESRKHNRVMKVFSEAIFLGRMANTIYNIQKEIIKQREAIA